MIDKKNMKERVKLNDFGLKLRELRKKENLKQGELAEKLDFTRTYVNEFEAGKWIPSFNFMSKLTEVFVDLEIKIVIREGKIEIDFGDESNNKSLS